MRIRGGMVGGGGVPVDDPMRTIFPAGVFVDVLRYRTRSETSSASLARLEWPKPV